MVKGSLEVKFRIDVPEGGESPDQWIAWGDIVPISRSAPVGRYFQLRFPSYRFKEDLWTDKWCWHQLCFVEIRFPNVNEKYLFDYFPIRNA